MDLDKEFVQSVLRGGRDAYLMALDRGIDPEIHLFGDGKTAWEYVVGHWKEYIEVPELDTVLVKTGVDLSCQSDESHAFFIDELFNRRTAHLCGEGTKEIVGKLEVDGALELPAEGEPPVSGRATTSRACGVGDGVGVGVGEGGGVGVDVGVGVGVGVSLGGSSISMLSMAPEPLRLTTMDETPHSPMITVSSRLSPVGGIGATAHTGAAGHAANYVSLRQPRLEIYGCRVDVRSDPTGSQLGHQDQQGHCNHCKSRTNARSHA